MTILKTFKFKAVKQRNKVLVDHFIEVDQQTANILLNSDKAKVAVERPAPAVSKEAPSCPPKPPSKRGRSKNSLGEEQ